MNGTNVTNGLAREGLIRSRCAVRRRGVPEGHPPRPGLELPGQRRRPVVRQPGRQLRLHLHDPAAVRQLPDRLAGPDRPHPGRLRRRVTRAAAFHGRASGSARPQETVGGEGQRLRAGAVADPGAGHPAVAGGTGMVLLRLPGRHAAGGSGRRRGSQPGMARHAGQRHPRRPQGADVRARQLVRRADGRCRRAAGPLHPGHSRLSPVVRNLFPARVRGPGDLLDVPDPQPRAGAPARPSAPPPGLLSPGVAGRAAARCQLRPLPGQPGADDPGSAGSDVLRRVRTRGVRRERRLRGHPARCSWPARSSPCSLGC